VSDELAGFPLLADLGPDERRAVAQELEWLSFEQGVALFREGEPADGLVLLIEGRVRLVSRRTGCVGECGAGACLGALSLVAEGAREATGETLSRCRMLRLSREAYGRLVAGAPRAACQLLEAVLRDSAAVVREALAAVVE
jgi:CRP/FNR family cyclic AMP-dependent transcriptional regulator